MPTLSSKTDQASFAALVMDRYRQKGYTGTLVYLGNDFSLDLGDKLGKAFLGNVYRDWLNAREADKVPTIDKLVDTSLQMERLTKAGKPRLFDDVAPNLLPVIRSRAYVENLWMNFDPVPKGDEDQIIITPNRRFSDDLSVMVAIDMPDAFGFVGTENLKAWHKTFDDVYAVALANLLQKAKPQFEKIQPGLFGMEGLDFYQPSLLLLASAFKDANVKGDIVAVPVIRNALIVTGTRDDKALAVMVHAAEGTFANDSRPLSLMPLVLKNKVWVSYDAPLGLVSSLDRLRLEARVADYKSQKGTLEAHFNKTGRETYVADIELIQIENGRLLSFTTLASGIEILLPQAQVVVIAPPDMGQPFARRWEDVVTVFGTPAFEPNTWPPRYVFSGRMDNGKVAKLKAMSDAPDFPKLQPEA